MFETVSSEYTLAKTPDQEGGEPLLQKIVFSEMKIQIFDAKDT